MPCRTGFRVPDASAFAHELLSVGRGLVAESRSDTRSAGRKPRLGNIATPGRVCPPHNETYDCRIHPNGIGCFPTRRRLGYRPDGCLTGQESAFRTDPTSERSAALGFRSGRTESPRRAAFRQRAEKRERTERRETNSPGIVSVRRRTAPRATESKMRPGRETGASASPARP